MADANIADRLKTGNSKAFRDHWNEVRRESGRLSPTDAWRRSGQRLLTTWEVLMESVLSKTSWLALKLLLERRRDVRRLWTETPWTFFSVSGYRGPIEKPIITVTMRDRVKETEILYESVLEEDAPNLWNDVSIAMLALAGHIVGGVPLVGDLKRIKRTFTRLERADVGDPLLWDKSVKDRLRGAMVMGWLSKPWKVRKRFGRRSR